MIRSRRELVLPLSVIGMLLISCGGSSPTTGQGPFVIGYTIALTGPNNAFDGPSYNGAQIAVDDINAAGGVCGRQLKIITTDYASDQTQVVPAANKIVEDGAQIVSPSNDYGLGGPAARVANAAGLLTVSEGGDPRMGKQGVGPLEFNIFTTTPTEGATAAEYAWSKGWRHPYLLTDTSIDYSKDVANYFKVSWAGLGGQIAGEDSWLNSDASIAAQITRLKGQLSKVDVVILSSYDPGAPTAVRQLRASGIQLPIFGNIGYDSLAWLPSVPNLSNFWAESYGSIEGDDPYDGRSAFGVKYKARFGVAGNDYSPMLGYSEIQLMAFAITKAGCTTKGTALQNVLEQNPNIPTMSGLITYSTQCHTPSRDFYIAEVENGKRTLQATFHVQKLPPAPC